MTTVNDIFSYLNEKAPISLKMDFDNVGLLVGSKEASVSKVLVALDITSDVIQEASSKEADLIVSHHPVIWDAMKSLRSDNVQQDKVINLIKNNIAAICMHTNLDIVDEGVNDVLLKKLGLKYQCILDEYENEIGCGRIGILHSEMELNEFLEVVKIKLNNKGLRYFDAGRPVKRVAVMGGAGGSSLETAFNKDCDTYVTSDIKYDQFLLASELKINLIDAGHYCTEHPIVYTIKDWLETKFNYIDVIISDSNADIIDYIM